MRSRARLLAAAAAVTISGGTSSSRAEESNGVSYFAAGTPVAKIDFRSDGVYANPSFFPGPGFGYIAHGGYFGAVLFPTIAILGTNNMSFVPHVAFHAFFINVGVGWQFNFIPTNGGTAKFAGSHFVL